MMAITTSCHGTLMKKSGLLAWLLTPALIGLTACRGVPEGLTVVESVDLDRYLGRWYEIARMDHSYERGLSHVTAHYSLREDGSIRVLNTGYKAQSEKWKQAEGKALRDAPEPKGKFKVSFFGPFYGAYNIIKLDPEYQHVMIAGSDRNSFWLLSRDPNMPEVERDAWLNQAKQWGFATDELIFVEQDLTKAKPFTG